MKRNRTGSFLLLALGAFAATEALAGWSPAVSIANIEAIDTTGDSTRVFLYFSTVPHSTTCSYASSNAWRVLGGAEHVKNILAIATAARLAERQVKVFFRDSYSGTASCDNGGTSGYQIISGIQMQ